MEELGRIDPKDRAMVAEAVSQCKDSVRGQPVEHAWVIQRDGTVLHSSGDDSSVSLDGADLDGAVVVHNHPLVDGEPCSFGKDDFEKLRESPGIAELIAVSGPYEYSVKALRPLDIGYDDAVKRVLSRLEAKSSKGEDLQHLVMEWLNDEGYVRYSRKDVQGQR